MSISTQSIVRDRGQITLPQIVRRQLSWLEINSPIQIYATNQEIIIKPYLSQSTTSWQKIWDSLALAQSFIGKRGNLSQFIVSDRDNH
jgi:bifunctional DNA-binding transcriptional regulator/antitoxin component of YhaV-PrlF toxin-antitoxin module